MQAVSCDEAFLDVSDSEVEDHQRLASIIRKEVFDTTGCKASVGIAGNMLMARLATRTAKPDGQCYIPADKVCADTFDCYKLDCFLNVLKVEDFSSFGTTLKMSCTNSMHLLF